MAQIEDLFLTREQAKHLQELGLDMKDAAFCWYKVPFKDSKWQIIATYGRIKEYMAKYDDLIPTYTLQELLSKFPPKYHDRVIAELTNGVKMSFGHILEISRCTGADDEVFYGFHYGSNLFNGVTDPNPLQAAYKMMCWLHSKEEKK